MKGTTVFHFLIFLNDLDFLFVENCCILGASLHHKGVFMRTQTHSLLEGPVLPSLLAFSLPVILTMVTTQLYSTVDTMIVGRMLDADALAAVSNASVVLMIFLFISGGMELGANLLAAAARPTATREEMAQLTYNLLVCDSVLAIAMLVLGEWGIGAFLRLIQTPAEIQSDAVLYARIYLLGLPFMMLYDLCKEILIGYGDSRLPMYLVLATSALNIVLDVPFIALWGVGGAAAATAFSQFVGCTVILWVLRRRMLCIPFSFSLLKSHYVREIARLSIPNMLQQASGPAVSLVRQGLLGTLGVAAIAGYSVADKTSSLLLYPIYGLVQSLVVFIAQNTAARQTNRIQKGVRQAQGLILAYTALVVAACMLLARPLLGFFTSDADVLAYGALLLTHLAPTYFFTSLKHVQEARLRGAQKMGLYLLSSLVPTLLGMVLSLVLVPRVGYAGFYWTGYITAPLSLVLSAALAHHVCAAQTAGESN
jgi:putative MATE family efflux protein